MKAIYSTQSLPEAGLLQGILRDHGIEAVIEHESSPIPAAAPPTLLVDDDNEVEALRLIREHLGQKAP